MWRMLVLILLIGCASIPKPYVGMKEPEFHQHYSYATLVESDGFSSIYKMHDGNMGWSEVTYHYFVNGELVKIDQGTVGAFPVHITHEVVTTSQ